MMSLLHAVTRTKNVKIFQIIFVKGDSLYLAKLKAMNFFAYEQCLWPVGEEKKPTSINSFIDEVHELGTTVGESNNR